THFPSLQRLPAGHGFRGLAFSRSYLVIVADPSSTDDQFRGGAEVFTVHAHDVQSRGEFARTDGHRVAGAREVPSFHFPSRQVVDGVRYGGRTELQAGVSESRVGVQF